MAAINHISGVNVIMNNGTSILSSSGFGDQGAPLADVVNGVTPGVAVIVGMSLMTRGPGSRCRSSASAERHLAAGHWTDFDAGPGRYVLWRPCCCSW